MLYTSPSKSSSSRRIPPIPGGRLRAKKRTFPENRLLDSIPTPNSHFNPIGCFSLASSPQSAKFKSVLKDRMTPRELMAFASASRECPVIGLERKSSARGLNDAIDPSLPFTAWTCADISLTFGLREDEVAESVDGSSLPP